MKKFLEERLKGEKESVLPFVGEEQIGGAYTLRKESEEELLRDVDPYIIRVGIKQRKRGGRKFRERQALPDENDTAASMRGITREHARPGMGAIRMQSRESRNPERGR